MTNYLFICHQNKIRSKAIAKYFSKLLQKRSIEGCVESAGLYVEDEEPDSWGCRSRKINKELCNVADVIFVMEEYMNNKLVEDFGVDKGKIVNLDILDVYWSGQFNQVGLDFGLCGKSEEEKQKIRERPEIQNKWDLKRVLIDRKLEQYIK